MTRSIRCDCPEAVKLLREIAENNPYRSERMENDALSTNENLWLLNCLEIEGVLNITPTPNGLHTSFVVELSKEGDQYSFARFNPNYSLETAQLKNIREDYFYPTSGLMEGYLSSSARADAESKRGLAMYLSKFHFEKHSPEPGTLVILKNLESLNKKYDCGPICAYILWLSRQMENGQPYSIDCFESSLNEPLSHM